MLRIFSCKSRKLCFGFLLRFAVFRIGLDEICSEFYEIISRNLVSSCIKLYFSDSFLYISARFDISDISIFRKDSIFGGISYSYIDWILYFRPRSRQFDDRRGRPAHARLLLGDPVPQGHPRGLPTLAHGRLEGNEGQHPKLGQNWQHFPEFCKNMQI